MNVSKLKQYADSQNIIFLIAVVVAFSLLWNTASAVFYNYQLQQEADEIREDIALLELQNERLELDLSYYNSDDYFDRAIRRNLAKRGEGELLLNVPGNRDREEFSEEAVVEDNAPQVIKNVRAWKDFLFGS